MILDWGQLDLDSFLITFQLFNLNSVKLSPFKVVHPANVGKALYHGITLLALIRVKSKIANYLSILADSLNICY
jgi:hypothetical protein